MSFVFRSSIILIGITVVLHGSAQELILKGSVYDSGTELPLRGVNLKVKKGHLGTSTDGLGEFSLYLDSSAMNGLVLLVHHLGYESKEIAISTTDLTEMIQNDDKPLEVLLKSFTYPLDTAIIISDPLPEIVYSSARHNVGDFEFVGEELMLLVYPRRIEKEARLYLMDKEMEVQDSILLPKGIRAQGLRKDYAEELYLETEKEIFWIHEWNGRWELEPKDVKVFNETVVPVIDTIANTVYFSTFIEHFPAFEYYDVDLLDSVYTQIHQVADAFMLELCRAEYKYLSTRDKLRLYRLEIATGVEKEVLACIASFDAGLYYDPLYAPLFIWKDSLFLFDHVSSHLFVYDIESQPLDSIPIDYHNPEKVMGNPFTEELLMDGSTGQVYAIFQKPGGRCWLEQIDTETGLTKRVKQLKYRYPSAIQVKEGEVYYLYRPFESVQKKYLYKERL